MSQSKNINQKNDLIYAQIQLILIGVMAILVLFIDGKNFSFIKKFTAHYSVSQFDEVRDHEILQRNHIGHDKNKIVLLGSCMLGTAHCVSDRRNNDTFQECTVSELLEQKLIRHDIKNWRVANLSLPAFTIGHSLNIFLQTLEDPKFKTFIWQNDYKDDDSIFSLKEDEVMSYLPFIYQKLLLLKDKYPEIQEIKTLLTQIKGKYPHLEIPKENFLNHWVDGNQSVMAGTWNNIKEVISEIKHKNISGVARVLNQNTNYLRAMQSQLYKVFDLTVPESYYDDYLPQIKSSQKAYTPEYYQYKEERPQHQTQEGQILPLRIMGKLAEIYHKKIYFYIGPSTQCQKEHFLDDNFINPIKNGIQDLKAFHIMDMKRLKMEPRVDSFNCINFSILGKRKASEEIYRQMLENGDFNHE